jgi:hypothetical protein
MLDRSKLLVVLEHVAADIFVDTTHENKVLQHLWTMLIKDPLLKAKLAAAKVSWPLPTWDGEINATTVIARETLPYDLIAVDGSQIYPDRHSGISCYVINIGEVIFQYGQEKSVTFTTQPHIFTGNDEEGLDNSVELINGKRQDLELRAGYIKAQEIKSHDRKHLLLFDGSLIFWHLEAKEILLKELFLPRYLATLLALYHERIVCASYISAPKSHELMNVVKTYGSDFDERNQAKIAMLNRFTDAWLLHLVLKPYERTTVFKNHAKISEQYPDAVRPYFFYMHNGTEIGRVEIPAWVAQDEQLVDWIAATILDQCEKGFGYPIALAEAHEQAVIKGPDRDFFYHLLQKMSIDRKHHIAMSQKVIKKRGMGV